MSSKPRDFGVARLSSIPRPATSLLFRSSKPLDFRLVVRGCHQYHCRRRACVGPYTTGLWGSEAVLDTAASDEPAVQVLKTTGHSVGGKRMSSIPLPAVMICRSRLVHTDRRLYSRRRRGNEKFRALVKYLHCRIIVRGFA